MSAILAVSGLKVAYGAGRDRFHAVDGVTLSLARGQTLGLVGESGCGKSTIARALVGLEPVVDGSVHFDGADFSSESARDSRDYRSRVQMIFQDSYSSLNPRMTIGDMLSEALALRRSLPASTGARRQEAARTLELVGLPGHMLDRFPHQFSGGQRQRIAIARALAVGPDVIIHDEVTSSLDVSTQATILNLLKELQRKLGLSYVFISHDLSVVRTMSDSVAVMYLGRIVEYATTEALFSSPSHPYTIALINSVPKLSDHRRPAPLTGDLPDPKHPPSGCRFHTRCPVGPLAFPERTRCISDDPQGMAVARKNGSTCHFSALS